MKTTASITIAIILALLNQGQASTVFEPIPVDPKINNSPQPQELLAKPLRNLDDIPSWPEEQDACVSLANQRLKRDESQCRDMKDVVLPAVVGARENYINGCLSKIILVQLEISKKCRTNISFSPYFETFEYAKPLLGGSADGTVSSIVSYCRETGAAIRWINNCGPVEHFNTCIKVFTWWYSYVKRAQVPCRTTLPPLDPIPSECSGNGGSISATCVHKALRRILRIENECIKSGKRPNQPICSKYRVRDECRKITTAKARWWTKQCKSPVILNQFEDLAPEDCKLCIEGANKVL